MTPLQHPTSKRPVPKPPIKSYVLPKPRRMTAARWIILAAVLLVCGAGVAWATGMFRSSDARLAEVTAMGKKMTDPSLSAKDRAALMTKMRKTVNALSPDQKRKVFEQTGAMMMKSRMDHMQQVLALPADKQGRGTRQGHRLHDENVQGFRETSERRGKGRG